MSILTTYGVTDRFINESSLYSEFTLARVTAQYKGIYKIISENGEQLAEISGKLRYLTDELAKYPTVGDFVMVAADSLEDRAIIHHILSRKSVFLRTAVGMSSQGQTVAANIDVVFICMSLNNNFNLSRLERYLSVAWDSGAKPVIILTKTDLCSNLNEMVRDVERVAAFTDIITVSKFDDDTIYKLMPYLKNGITSAFIGSSGVGKSTLINRILGAESLETKEVGKADKGKHTTTGREMFPSPYGGVLIDTPGMRELGAESVNLSKSFDDIDELSHNCRFSNCSHTNEISCAILEALENGIIDRRRLDNYFKLKNEAGYEGLNSKEIEKKKLDRMFKSVGGMKNGRKAIKEIDKRR